MVKDIVILGGPNGAGKTTAAKKLLPDRLGISEFVNADEIALGLSPFNAEHAALAAGRIMLQRIASFISAGQSFAFETTCAGRSYVRTLQHCSRDGWRITLLFLWLPSPEAALARVARRATRARGWPRNSGQRSGAPLSSGIGKYAPLLPASGGRRGDLR